MTTKEELVGEIAGALDKAGIPYERNTRVLPGGLPYPKTVGEALALKEAVAGEKARRANRGVPHSDLFEGTGDFIDAPGLEELAETLCEKHPGLEWTRDWRIRFLWKRKGGASGGRNVLGKTTLASGMVKHFAKTDFVIWLGADHCRKLESRQIEALLYHEMQHLAVVGDEDEDLRPAIVGHDVEAFYAEVREYGSWKEDLKEMERTYKQMRMPL